MAAVLAVSVLRAAFGLNPFSNLLRALLASLLHTDAAAKALECVSSRIVS